MGWLAILALTEYTLGLHPAHGAEHATVAGWAVLITPDKAVYAPGDPITLTFQVVNGTKRPVTLTFRTAQRFDFVVRDREGREVWRWAAGRISAHVLGSETVFPSGMLAYTATVEKKLSPGVYTVTGLVTAQEGNLTASVVVRVEPN